MAGFNRVTILGNLGRDPEARFTQSGMAICKLSVAVTEKVKDGDAWKDSTEWFRVTVFGKQAENAAQYLQKGRSVLVEGRLKTEKYKDKDGVEKTSVELVANSVVFVGGGDDKGGGGKSKPAVPSAPAGGGDADDLPFARFEPCY